MCASFCISFFETMSWFLGATASCQYPLSGANLLFPWSGFLSSVQHTHCSGYASFQCCALLRIFFLLFCFFCCTSVCLRVKWLLMGTQYKKMFQKAFCTLFFNLFKEKIKENTRCYLTCLQLSRGSDSDHLAWSQIMSLMVALRAGNLGLGFQFQDCKVWISFWHYMNQDFMASGEINSVQIEAL